MFGVRDFWLEIMVIIKISTQPCYARIFDQFSWMKQKKFKMADSKKPSFSKSPILNIFSPKF
jgi:hypothetical protein